MRPRDRRAAVGEPRHQRVLHRVGHVDQATVVGHAQDGRRRPRRPGPARRRWRSPSPTGSRHDAIDEAEGRQDASGNGLVVHAVTVRACPSDPSPRSTRPACSPPWPTLAARDPDLAGIVARHGPPPLWARQPGFATLVHIILEQQVSLRSAEAALTRLLAATGVVDPRGDPWRPAESGSWRPG